MKRSRNRATPITSGPVVRPIAPVSRSTVPSRSAVLSLSGFSTKRSRTPGASVLTRAMRLGPKVSTKPSLVRSVKVRTSLPRSSNAAGRRTASASATSGPIRLRRSSARGVGTRPRPALTSKGSPVVFAQPRQGPAHRRRTEPQPFGGARHAAFREQDVQGDQQIEIGPRHGATIS